jgi:hypothetical protein
MTLSRITALVILLFCGTMTTLLVRSVYWPEETDLATVAPQVPVGLFLLRSEGSALDVWEGNEITGSLYLTPHSVNTDRETAAGRAGGRVRLEATLRLKQTAVEAKFLSLRGHCFFHTSGEVDDLDLVLTLYSLPEIRLAVKHPAGDRWPSLNLTRGNEVMFTSNGGQTPDAANSQLLQLLTAAAGISSDDLLAPAAEKTPATVRAGRITAGGEEHDGYYISPGGHDEGSFRLYIANTGEILRIETPFSRDSELGLRLLSQGLRPHGAVVPDLELYPLTPAPATP